MMDGDSRARGDALIHRQKSVDSDESEDQFGRDEEVSAAFLEWHFHQHNVPPISTSAFYDSSLPFDFGPVSELDQIVIKRGAGPVVFAQPQERSKKRKTAHRHIRSPALLFRVPESRPAEASSSARLFASSTAKGGKETRMAPSESSWTGDSAAWLDAEAIGLAQLSLTDEVGSPQVPSGRSRSISAPPKMMGDVPLSTPTPDASPETLKAQLLTILRARTSSEGGNGGRAGDAALRLRRWVHFNAWKRSTPLVLPVSPPPVTKSEQPFVAEKRAPSALSAAMARSPSVAVPVAEEQGSPIVIRLRLDESNHVSEAEISRRNRPSLVRSKSAPSGHLVTTHSTRRRQISGTPQEEYEGVVHGQRGSVEVHCLA